MAQGIRCVNPSCGHPSRLAGDVLGRTFRCTRCGSKLPATARARRGEAALPAADAPWEREDAQAGAGRLLGVASPSRVGRFRVQALLGTVEGVSAYSAVDPEPDGAGAAVVWVPSRAGLALAGPGSADAFLGAAQALARLDHPGLVPVLEAGRDGATVYLATALATGPTLADQLASGGRLEPVLAAEIVADLAVALEHAHTRGVVHRGLRPGCVRLGPGGRVRLDGFRLPRPVAGEASPAVSGAEAYLAPERLAAEPGAYLPASDQYSLGALLYTLLCGRPPYDGPARRVLEEIRTDDPIPPRDWRPRLSRRLEQICLRAMARNPAARYPSCLALGADLARWARRARTAAEAVDTVRSAAQWARRRPAAALSTLLAVAGLIATTTVLASALVASTSVGPSLSALQAPQAVATP